MNRRERRSHGAFFDGWEARRTEENIAKGKSQTEARDMAVTEMMTRRRLAGEMSFEAAVYATLREIRIDGNHRGWKVYSIPPIPRRAFDTYRFRKMSRRAGPPPSY